MWQCQINTATQSYGRFEEFRLLVGLKNKAQLGFETLQVEFQCLTGSVFCRQPPGNSRQGYRSLSSILSRRQQGHGFTSDYATNRRILQIVK